MDLNARNALTALTLPPSEPLEPTRAPGKWVNLTHAAAHWHVSRRTVYHWLRLGYLASSGQGTDRRVNLHSFVPNPPRTPEVWHPEPPHRPV